VTDEVPDCSAQPSGALIVKCPASDRWATNCVVSGMSPGTAESTGAGFSVEEGPGAGGEVGAGEVGAGWEAEGDGADTGLGAVLAQAPRRATSATRADPVRIRWVVFIAPPLS
jgi:hypothetical protein